MDSLAKLAIARWREANVWSSLFKSLAVAACVGAIALNALGETEAAILSLVALGSFFALFWVRFPTSERWLSRRLNRFPEFEHSAELLFQSPDELPFLARLQRQKIATLLQGAGARKFFATEARGAFLVFVGSLACSIALALAPSRDDASSKTSSPDLQGKTSEAELRLESVEVEIFPPAYARKPKRVQSSLDLVAEENATIVWRARLNRAGERLCVAMSSGDSVRFAQENETTHRAEWRAKASALYAICAESLVVGEGAIQVEIDRAPVISVLAPTERVEFASPDSATFVAKIAISDDYGVSRARLVATSAKGKGESVKFKTDAIPLAPKTTLDGGVWICETRLGLKTYGLTFGDELCFFIEAEDNREPAPNLARSETIVAKISDSLQVAPSEKIATSLLRLPAYFRSQRQLIIDTEKLIAERRSLDASRFRARSENLGVDQKLLRLRYGKFLGEELVASVGEMEIERLAKAMRDTSQHPIVKLQRKALARAPKLDDGHEHQEPTPNAPSVESLLEPFAHRHDIPEAATFFSEPIKQKLKAALAEMWEAEKFLRLCEPERALPFEIRALQRLKELQQEARLYVEKSGFASEPFDEARLRLSGDNANVQSVQVVETRRELDTLAVVKTALTILASDKRDFSDSDLLALEEAGKRLAQRALEQDLKLLSALRALRQLIGEARANRPFSQEARLVVLRGFWESLPPTSRLPQSPPSRASLPSARYFNSLNPTR